MPNWVSWLLLPFQLGEWAPLPLDVVNGSIRKVRSESEHNSLYSRDPTQENLVTSNFTPSAFVNCAKKSPRAKLVTVQAIGLGDVIGMVGCEDTG